MKMKIIFFSLSILIMTFSACSFFNTLTSSEFNDKKEEYNEESNTDLISLSVSDIIFTPNFNSSIKIYYATADINLQSVTIYATAKNMNSTIKINKKNINPGQESEPLDLNYGINVISIKVISFNENYSKIYRINIFREFDDAINWNKKYSNANGDYIESVYTMAKDANNNIYVAGTGFNLVSSSSSYDWWIKKFDSNGIEDTVNWNKKFSNTDESFRVESCNSIAVDSNNNIYVVGTGFNLVSSSSSYDWWIKKFDSNGIEDTTNWNKKFGNSVHNYQETANSIIIDSNNNIYVAGTGISLFDSHSFFDWWIKKFDPNGNEDLTFWNKKLSGGVSYSQEVESVYALAVDSNNNIYAVGSGYNLLDSDSTIDWWIKKFDSNGNEDTINWDKKFGPLYESIDIPNSIKIDHENNIYIAGRGEIIKGAYPMYCWWIKKFNTNGYEDTTYWDKKIYNFESDDVYEEAKSIAIDSNNNVYISGYGFNLVSASSGYDWWIKKFDSNGKEDTINWNIKISNYDSYSIKEKSCIIVTDSSDNILVAGCGYNLVSSESGYDWWIKKFLLE